MSLMNARSRQAAPLEDSRSHLMCSAHGCPNLWSTSDGHLCRWHADAEPHRWPEVTQQMLWEETERARLQADPQARPVSEREKREILDRLRTVLTVPKDPRAWLHKLRERDANGERLSPMQRHALEQCKHIGDAP